MELKEEREIHAFAMNYECFLSRSFKFDTRIRRANKQEFINLVNTESGNKLSTLPNFTKQLAEIKERLKRATEIYISQSSSHPQITHLTDLNIRISQIISYKEIPEIVEKGLHLTQNFI